MKLFGKWEPPTPKPADENGRYLGNGMKAQKLGMLVLDSNMLTLVL